MLSIGESLAAGAGSFNRQETIAGGNEGGAAARRPNETKREKVAREHGEAKKKKKAGGGGGGSSTGGFGTTIVTVKGVKATPAQRSLLDACFSQGQKDGASPRVLTAIDMAVTQESTAASLDYGDGAGPDSRGPFQQRAPWGPVEIRKDPAGSTHLFLTGGKGGQPGWKQKHGSTGSAPKGISLSRAINQVQNSAFPDAYAQWEAEAKKNVAAWRGGTFGDSDRTVIKSFEFTRGQTKAGRGDGERGEDSFTATGRLATDVHAHRWVAGNVFYAVSDDELRLAPPSLTLDGRDTGVERQAKGLLSKPGFEMSDARRVQRLSLRVHAARWNVSLGAVVEVINSGVKDGRWLVAEVRGSLRNPEKEIVLTRPRPLLPEPPAERETKAATTGGATSRDGDGLIAACLKISSGEPPYVYGGFHGPALGSYKSGAGLDCSSSTSLALKRAGMFPGDTAIVSGAFAASWGRPGKGKGFTVWANAEHVWVEFHDAAAVDGFGKPTRFDTSPHGDTHGSGARVRTTTRPTAGFTARHWPGR